MRVSLPDIIGNAALAKALAPMTFGDAVLEVSRDSGMRPAVSSLKSLCSVRASVATENSDIEPGRERRRSSKKLPRNDVVPEHVKPTGVLW